VTARAVIARGHTKSLSAEEREEISKTVIREALDSGRCIVWNPITPRKASSSALFLGIVVALAAPLQSVSSRGEGLS